MLPSFAQSFASSAIRQSPPSPPIETQIDNANPPHSPPHSYTLPPIEHIDSRATNISSRSSSRSPSHQNPHQHLQQHQRRPYSNSVSAIDAPAASYRLSQLGRKRSHDVASGLRNSDDDATPITSRMSDEPALSMRSATPASRQQSTMGISAGSSGGRHILDRGAIIPERHDSDAVDGDNLRSLPALVRVKEEDIHEDNSPRRSRANSQSSHPGFQSPAVLGASSIFERTTSTSSLSRQQQHHGGSQQHAPAFREGSAASATQGGEIMFRASAISNVAATGLMTSLPKKRRVTVSGDAPSSLRYSGSGGGHHASPLIPVPLRGLNTSATPEDVEQLKIALTLKQQQKALISARRTGKSGNATPEPLLSSSLSSPLFAPPPPPGAMNTNTHNHHHQQQPHRVSDPRTATSFASLTSPVSPWDSSDVAGGHPPSFTSASTSTMPHENDPDYGQDHDTRDIDKTSRASASSSPSRSPHSPRPPRIRKIRHSHSAGAGVMGIITSGPTTNEPSLSTVEAALDIEMEVEEGGYSDATQSQITNAASPMAGRRRTQSNVFPTSSASGGIGALRGISHVSSEFNSTPISRHSRHAPHPFAHGHTRGGREVPLRPTVRTSAITSGNGPMTGPPSGPRTGTGTPTIAEMERSLNRQMQQQGHRMDLYAAAAAASHSSHSPHSPSRQDRDSEVSPPSATSTRNSLSVRDHGSMSMHDSVSASSMATVRRATPTAVHGEQSGVGASPNHSPPRLFRSPLPPPQPMASSRGIPIPSPTAASEYQSHPHPHPYAHQQPSRGYRDYRERDDEPQSLPSLHTLHSEIDFGDRSGRPSPSISRRDSFVSTSRSPVADLPPRFPPISTTGLHHAPSHHPQAYSHAQPTPSQRAPFITSDTPLTPAPPTGLTGGREEGHSQHHELEPATPPIDQIISRGRFISLFEGMYDSMVDARRVRAWIEEQHSIRAADVGSEPPSHGAAAGDSPPFSRTTATPAPPPAGGSAAAISGGVFIRAEDIQSIVDARVDLVRSESRREIERLADRVRELEKRVSSGPASGSPDGAEEINESHDLQLDSLRTAEPESEVARQSGPDSDSGSGLVVNDDGVVRQGSATPATPDAPQLLPATEVRAPQFPADPTPSANAAGEMDVDVDEDLSANTPAHDAANHSPSGL